MGPPITTIADIPPKTPSNGTTSLLVGQLGHKSSRCATTTLRAFLPSAPPLAFSSLRFLFAACLMSACYVHRHRETQTRSGSLGESWKTLNREGNANIAGKEEREREIKVWRAAEGEQRGGGGGFLFFLAPGANFSCYSSEWNQLYKMLLLLTW